MYRLSVDPCAGSMGNHLSAYRLPAEWAAELISGHEPLDYLEYLVPESPIYAPPEAERHLAHGVAMNPEDFDHSVRRLGFGRHERRIADMLNGEYHFWDNDERPFSRGETETDDPLEWAVYGRRVCGWLATAMPYRFSNPSDVPQIAETLAGVTPAEMSDNYRNVVQQFPPPTYQSGYGESGTPGVIVDLRVDDPVEYARKTLANLCGFYDRARANEEFVVHCWV